MTTVGFPPGQPVQAQTGNVEIDLTYGGDLSQTANGDLVLALDLPGNPLATTERVQRLLYTNARTPDDNGGYASPGDDIFNPDWGAGLPAKVGTMFPTGSSASGAYTSAALVQIRSQITRGLAVDPSIAQSPAPDVVVDSDVNNPYQIDINVVCTAVTGEIITVPASPITGGS